MKYQALFSSKDKSRKLKCCLLKFLFGALRVSDFCIQVMLVIGGQAPKAIRSVECYDFKEDRWFQLAEMPSRRCRCGMSVNESCSVPVSLVIRWGFCLRKQYEKCKSIL